jgi:hypothetical protein
MKLNKVKRFGNEFESLPSRDESDIELPQLTSENNREGDKVEERIVEIVEQLNQDKNDSNRFKTVSQLLLPIYIPSFLNVAVMSLAVPAIPIFTLVCDECSISSCITSFRPFLLSNLSFCHYIITTTTTGKRKLLVKQQQWLALLFRLRSNFLREIVNVFGFVKIRYS